MRSMTHVASRFRISRVALLGCLIGLSATCPVFAQLNPATPPASLQIEPAEFTLIGPRAEQQLLVTVDSGLNSVRDATADVTYESDNPQVVRITDGRAQSVGDGTATITARAGSVSATARVTVQSFQTPARVPFHTEVLAALTKSGCNMGACHGSPSGKGGFRLSLRGYDPELDLVTLRGEFFNRRANVLQPDESLLLRKPLMEVAHGGGRRLSEGDASHLALREWIAEGMQTEPEGTPTLDRIELLPSPRVLRDGAERQQLVVKGYFSDGTVRDVTALTAFDTSDETIASITRNGVVEREGRGEATILARYLDRMSTTQLTFLTERPDFQWPSPPEIN
ncbi:MAG: Ig-like domain-containing protein, partial [Planctomycetaceae bacterium]|nr:Ig-like domain-containing protein [Planctomycetaceae bacterium]